MLMWLENNEYVYLTFFLFENQILSSPYYINLYLCVKFILIIIIDWLLDWLIDISLYLAGCRLNCVSSSVAFSRINLELFILQKIFTQKIKSSSSVKSFGLNWNGYCWQVLRFFCIISIRYSFLTWIGYKLLVKTNFGWSNFFRETVLHLKV